VKYVEYCKKKKSQKENFFYHEINMNF